MSILIPSLEHTQEITDLIEEGLRLRYSMGPEYKDKVQEAINRVILNLDPIKYQLDHIEAELENNPGFIYKSLLKVKRSLALCHKNYWEVNLGQLEYLSKVIQKTKSINYLG